MSNQPRANSTPLLGLFSKWSPPLLWIIVIYLLSTDLLSGENTSRIIGPLLKLLFPSLSEAARQTMHLLIRKAGHFAEYAILAALFYRALSRSRVEGGPLRSSILLSFFLTAGYSLLDEFHQTFTRTRSGSIYDSLIDMSGAATILALISIWRVRGKTQQKA